MPANTSPIHPIAATFGAVAVTAANTSSQGGGTIGTDIFLILTTGANGSFISKIRCMPTASAAGTATTATVARFFLSTQSTGATTSSNTHNIGELTLASQTADSSTDAVRPLDYPLYLFVPTGYSLLVTNHAAPAANTAWKFTALSGGDF